MIFKATMKLEAMNYFRKTAPPQMFNWKKAAKKENKLIIE